jgi:Acyl-CoA thioester hydrolase/BAAT N-terminal region
MTSLSPTTGPRIVITPDRPTLDAELRIRVTGLTPHARVTVAASQLDPLGMPWTASASFTAWADGTVDLRRDQATAGSYTRGRPDGPDLVHALCRRDHTWRFS